MIPDPNDNPAGLGQASQRPLDDTDDEFVCQLTGLQLDLRTFIAHLTPFYDAQGDILQEVNLLVWKKRDQFKPGSNFRAWVYTFARNVTMKYQKRARRENELMFSAETIDALAEDFIAASPVFDERLHALRHCLKKVPDREKRLLLNRYAQYGSVAREAKTSTKSDAALRGILFRLRVALRRCVEKEMNGEFFRI